MKSKLLSFALLLLTSLSVWAQAPERFNYQAVARNSSGGILANQAMSVRINIRAGSTGGPIIYQETHAVSTSALGLFTLAIGGGVPLSGTLGNVDWSANSFYIETEIDPAGGSSYTSLGAAQLLSVPYALFAQEGGNWKKSINNITNTNTGNVGIGIATPTAKLHVEQSGSNTLVKLKRTGTVSGSEMLQIEADSIISSNDLISLNVPASAPATAQFIEFERGGIPVAQINTNGDIDTDGEYQRKVTTDANLVPIAYGYVAPSGTISSTASTFNFTVTKTAAGVYQIAITGVTNHNNLAVSFTAKNSSAVTPDFVNFGSMTSYLTVYTFTYTGGTFNAQDDDFSFVAYYK